jgi:hypothetical protein
VFRPAPDEWVPRTPGKLANKLTKVSRELDLSIRIWRTEGDPSVRRVPKRVVLQTLYQQRIFRMMTRKPTLGDATLRRLPADVAPFARGSVKAGKLLRSMVKRPVPPDFTLKLGRKKPAAELLRLYKAAQLRFGIRWEVLAAINMIETKFNRVRSTSSAGAQGPMQFMPATWDAYGMGGNIYNPRDAIMGAANYLRASGAPGDYRRALWNYNHSYAYVDAVLAYAKRMMASKKNYFIYYNWQVYVVTTEGDKRLTGPTPR